MRRGRFRVYVYAKQGQPHHRPHCNVRAERAGIPPRTLSRIEQGKQEMVLSTVQSLLAAMGCTLSHVVAEAAEATEPPEVAAPR